MKCLRIKRISLSASWSTVPIPIASSFLPIRRPMPQTSLTGSSAISFRCRCGQDKSTTPPVCRGHCFAAWLASFARVLVWAMPTPSVRWVRCSTVARISRPKSVRSLQ
ncbi:hypothetical protein MTE2_4638 [Klebsiella pneumoniae VA360]|nr:hypothetical protein MTE2_4638 [Klebsiella pneumoniae VA360]